MHDAVIVEVCDGGKRGSNQIASVGLVVVSFATNAVEQLSSEGKIGNEVDCSPCQVRRIGTEASFLRLFIVSK